MSQRELAGWSGVAKSTIADVESGRCGARVDTAERLLATMGLALALARQDGQELGAPLGAPLVDPRRDRGGRQVPPHLDVRARAAEETRGSATPLRWRRDREVRDVLRRYGCLGDGPYAGPLRRGDPLDPAMGIADLWLRGWPYRHDLELAGELTRDRAEADLRRGLRAAVRLTGRPPL